MIACSVVLALFSNCLRDFQAISKKYSESNELFFNQSFKVAQNMDLQCIKILILMLYIRGRHIFKKVI